MSEIWDSRIIHLHEEVLESLFSMGKLRQKLAKKRGQEHRPSFEAEEDIPINQQHTVASYAYRTLLGEPYSFIPNIDRDMTPLWRQWGYQVFLFTSQIKGTFEDWYDLQNRYLYVEVKEVRQFPERIRVLGVGINLRWNFVGWLQLCDAPKLGTHCPEGYRNGRMRAEAYKVAIPQLNPLMPNGRLIKPHKKKYKRQSIIDKEQYLKLPVGVRVLIEHPQLWVDAPAKLKKQFTEHFPRVKGSMEK